MPTATAQGAEDWEAITPAPLIEAVRHIRRLFDEHVQEASRVNTHLCRLSLHCPPAEGEETASDFFNSYCDLYIRDVAEATEKGFSELLAVGLANESLLPKKPVDWAKSHLQILHDNEKSRVKFWIELVCDGEPHGLFSRRPGKPWYAPKFLNMQPCGNNSYDTESAWMREDEATTEKLLQSLSRRFIESFKNDLDRIAGDAYLKLAKNVQRPAQSGVDPVNKGLVRKVRVPKQGQHATGVIFGAIQARLKGLEYCRYVDGCGIRPPAKWQAEGCPSTYVAAYQQGQPWRKKIQDQKHRSALSYERTSQVERERLIQAVARR